MATRAIRAMPISAETVLLPNNRYEFSVNGYVWTNDRSKVSGAAMPAMPAAARKPALEYHEKLSAVRDLTRTELAADWIISSSPSGGTWMGITASGRVPGFMTPAT